LTLLAIVILVTVLLAFSQEDDPLKKPRADDVLFQKKSSARQVYVSKAVDSFQKRVFLLGLLALPRSRPMA